VLNKSKMKSVTLFVALAAIAKIAYAGVAITPRTDSDNAYCPQTTGKCNAENKPTKEIKGALQLQIGDDAKCSGTVVVENECEFKVKDFVLNLEGRENKKVYWWGSKVFNKGTGAGVKLSSKEVEEQKEEEAEFSADENEGCWANLTTDIGAVYLMDSEDNVICHAIIRNDLTDEKSGSSSSKASASSTVAPSGSGAAGATTTAPAAATTTKKTTSTTTAATKPADDGSSSRYLISSSALYLVLFAIAFLF